jgi:hypothetical protein
MAAAPAAQLMRRIVQQPFVCCYGSRMLAHLLSVTKNASCEISGLYLLYLWRVRLASMSDSQVNKQKTQPLTMVHSVISYTDQHRNYQ